MRRWHEEREMMLRRWRFEIAIHEGWPIASLHPIPPVVCDDSCHCYLGPGFFRDRHPLDCGRSQCGVCHTKPIVYRAEKKRERRKAMEREWIASEGW